MKIKTNVILAVLLGLSLSSMSQSTTAGNKPVPKQIAAVRMTGTIKLDGLIDDTAWKNAPAALGYTEFRPTPFRKEDDANKSEVYMLYNDEGIYLGGYC
ncbi:MAG: hypothetical protein ACRDEB_08575, partial [Chitinophagaceae bacterium]